ncbi:hypothetical protein HPB52_024035 [Rhipicephalus sanguineus]|uniref:Uncharacterized protein n=1 Tax=Rhipicephalus sanguineus TaxID=34632 RepID=A0A9D4PXX5_RHISA|nr:hypothetical protein HPB52_024035 [Rhipicephalus sanguineus]
MSLGEPDAQLTLGTTMPQDQADPPNIGQNSHTADAPGDAVCGSYPTGVETLRELIRSVVRDELQQLHQAQRQPTTNYIASILREEVQHALGAHRREAPVQDPAPL